MFHSFKWVFSISLVVFNPSVEESELPLSSHIPTSYKVLLESISYNFGIAKLQKDLLHTLEINFHKFGKLWVILAFSALRATINQPLNVFELYICQYFVLILAHFDPHNKALLVLDNDNWDLLVIVMHEAWAHNVKHIGDNEARCIGHARRSEGRMVELLLFDGLRVHCSALHYHVPIVLYILISKHYDIWFFLSYAIKGVINSE